MSFEDIGEDTAYILDEETEHLKNPHTNIALSDRFIRAREKASDLPQWNPKPRKRSRSQSITTDNAFSSPFRSPYQSPGTASTWAETSDSATAADNDKSDSLADSLKKSMRRARASLVDQSPAHPRSVPTPRISDPNLDSISPACRELRQENADLKLELANAKSEIKNLRDALKQEKDEADTKLDLAVRQLRKGYNDKLRDSCGYYYRQVKKSFEEQVSGLEDALNEERQQKEELLEACDRFFDKQLADLAE